MSNYHQDSRIRYRVCSGNGVLNVYRNREDAVQYMRDLREASREVFDEASIEVRHTGPDDDPYLWHKVSSLSYSL